MSALSKVSREACKAAQRLFDQDQLRDQKDGNVFRIASLIENATGLVELKEALAESVKLQAHYATLLNQWDGGKRIVFPDAEAWLARLRELRKAAQGDPALYA